jgi:glutamate---cysteine ligase / carboxylate-amine ligase
VNHTSDIAVANVEALPLGAFQGYGIELEYMLVAQPTLEVMPIADEVFHGARGQRGPGELVHGPCAWSNELVAHVVELKNIAPTAELEPLSDMLQEEIVWFNARLEHRGAQLMPGGMHPWMDPITQTRLWPHEPATVYRAYDRIFNCRAHGWANVQSTHINLPFANDEEFARLHAAVRLVVPIIPAIAASSPFAEARAPGPLDCRMEAYRNNSSALPSITGEVVPEPVSSRAAYEHTILQPMYAEIAPHDPAGVLRQEWLNSRGAIARFSRNAIEIRVMDVQECPRVDVALAALVIDSVSALYEECFAPLSEQQQIPTAALAHVFLACLHDAERAVIDDERYLRLFGIQRGGCDAGALWSNIAGGVDAAGGHLAHLWKPVLAFVLKRGTLARRLLHATGRNPSREALLAVYQSLCHALATGENFEP